MSRQIGAKRQKYSAEVLEEATRLVRSEAISLIKASKLYGVPKSTLHNAVHDKYSCHKVGHRTVLSDVEEKRIADWAIHMARIGYGRIRQELANTVKKIMDDDGRPNPFKDNRPGKEWIARFFTRHPALSLRTTIQLGKERAIISAEKINNWFSKFKSYIENEVGDPELLKDPSRIYNADETGVSLCMKGNQVIGLKGTPVVYHFSNSDKTQITVMAACSATGHYIPPMLIFPGQRFSYNPLDGFEEAALGRSDNGWMDCEVFCNWLENVFIPSVNERKLKKPVLLLIDGHVTHVTMKASDICLENGIELYCLLEHASHVLQPLDLRLFSALKKSWRQSVRDWQAEHIGEYVNKQNFARVFKKAWCNSSTVEAAVKGFQEAGLFPLDPSIVSSSIKLEPSKVFQSAPLLSTSADSIKHVSSSTNVVSSTCEGTTLNGSISQPNKDLENQTPDMKTDGNSKANEETEIQQTTENTDSQLKTNETPPSQASPFSKHLSIPVPKSSTKPKVARKLTIPKAITGSEYRKLMEEKRQMREEENKEKEQRKIDRERKRKVKEEEKMAKKAEAEAKRRKRVEEMKKKREMRDRILQSLEKSSSDSDDAVTVDRNNCYTCDKPYTNNYIECSNCLRKFHVECVADDYLNILPFECRYC